MVGDDLVALTGKYEHGGEVLALDPAFDACPWRGRRVEAGCCGLGAAVVVGVVPQARCAGVGPGAGWLGSDGDRLVV